MKKVSIYVTEKELNALDDVLVAWNLCKKHRALTWNAKTGKALTEQEIFKMQDECPACTREDRRMNRLAGRIMVKLFDAFDKKK